MHRILWLRENHMWNHEIIVTHLLGYNAYEESFLCWQTASFISIDRKKSALSILLDVMINFHSYIAIFCPTMYDTGVTAQKIISINLFEWPIHQRNELQFVTWTFIVCSRSSSIALWYFLLSTEISLVMLRQNVISIKSAIYISSK